MKSNSSNGAPSDNILPFRRTGKRNPDSGRKSSEAQSVQQLEMDLRRYDPHLCVTLGPKFFWRLQGMMSK